MASCRARQIELFPPNSFLLHCTKGSSFAAQRVAHSLASRPFGWPNVNSTPQTRIHHSPQFSNQLQPTLAHSMPLSLSVCLALSRCFSPNERAQKSSPNSLSAPICPNSASLPLSFFILPTTCHAHFLAPNNKLQTSRLQTRELPLAGELPSLLGKSLLCLLLALVFGPQSLVSSFYFLVCGARDSPFPWPQVDWRTRRRQFRGLFANCSPKWNPENGFFAIEFGK